MRKRTIGVLVGVLLVLGIGTLSCALGQLMARQSSVAILPTRTPQPTWTPIPEGVAVATPTLDATRFPDLVLPTATGNATPQILVPGQEQPLVVPQPGNEQGVQTVVVVIVTATPPAPSGSGNVGGATVPAPGPTITPGPPTATPTITPTPLPPVMIRVTTDNAFVRQGPGQTYAPISRLERDTEVTVVGRNREGDWWKICCVNGRDVWIADSVVEVEGPLWTVVEVTDYPPPPPPSPTPNVTAGPSPTPTDTWEFHVEGAPQEYPLGQNYFKVTGVIYDGATPLWGYKLKIRKLSTGEEWLSDGSEAYWNYETIQWASEDESTPQVDLKWNVQWDSNRVSVPMGNDVWEVTATDGAGNALSAPVRFNTSLDNSMWYYVVFTSR